MGEIVALRRPASDDPDDVPHLAGKARCLRCGHKWEAVAPIGASACLTCPSCGAHRGEFVANVERDGEHWRCDCGCEVFRIRRDGIYCGYCGIWHRPFD